MIRCSSAYKICTHKPNFDEDVHEALVTELSSKLSKKKLIYDERFIETYCSMAGVITIARKVKTSLEKKARAENDPLPDGAKTYLEERWLELNYNMHDLSTTDSMPQIQKGNLCERDAIKLVGKRYNLDIKKNDNKPNTFLFLTGSYDVKYSNVIRDIKVPETWKTFRKVQGIPAVYYWQLIAYCLLEDCNRAYLDYVLMPYPEEMIPLVVKNLNQSELLKFIQVQATINGLDIKKRIKSYRIESDIYEEIEFLKSRLVKAEEYYDSLTYEKCMKMAVQ